MKSSKKLPSFSQWKQIFKVLKKSERISLLSFVVLAIGSLSLITGSLYIKNTKSVPAYSGTYIEGVAGQPRYINPIYGETNDIDRTLIDLVYSGLMSYDKDGNLAKDLASDYQVSADGKVYTFQLKDNVYWHDGVKLTADDIIYTIKTIQNSDYKSPLRANWLDVNAEKTSDYSLTFTLRTPYNSFLENCAVRIIPQHIWQNILPENFALSRYNLQPIGTGPYILSKIQQEKEGFIKTIDLDANRRFYAKVPYISRVSFQFFENKTDLIKAANQKTINGFSLSAFDNGEAEAEKEIKQGWSSSEKFAHYSMAMPRYFAVFFNTQKSKMFYDSNLRQALSYAINKDDLVKKLKEQTKNNISAANSPIIPSFYSYNDPTVNYPYNIEKTKQLLQKIGYKDNGSGQMVKENDKKPAFQFSSYLKIGSKGKEVTELQNCLAKLDENFKTLLNGETSGTFGSGSDKALTEFQKKYMPDAKPTGETGSATRKKLNEMCLTPQDTSVPLKFTITTVNQPQMTQVANLLKEYWQAVGASVDINAVDLSSLKQIIKERNYDILLYGEALGSLPDLYPFWHSSQVNDPGLNLTSYQNKDVDQLLKDGRETLDADIKKQKYEKMQDVMLKDCPAIFLYNSDYNYWVSEKIKGIETGKIVDPAKRFANISEWYMQTRRVWK